MAAVEEIVNLSDIEDDDCVLESITYEKIRQDSEIKQNTILNCDAIFKENPLLAEFIEKCLNIESSGGMFRVINKTLLHIYKEADAVYKASPEFESVLKRILIRLDTDPNHRFTHIKDLCEKLQSSKFKKRVNLITLQKNIRGQNTSKLSLKRKNNVDRTSKRPKTDIIDLDRFEEVPIINLDGDQYETVISNDHNKVVVGNDSPIVIDNEKENDTSKTNGKHLVEKNADKLLVPQKIFEMDEAPKAVDVEKIKNIELEIARYKEIIAKLDQEEVTNDNLNSPYIKSEKLKARIVALYKELCTLTGSEETKRREVRLTVIEGHPPGPMKRLENFLNANIGSDGNPPFPDFRDVVKCVVLADTKDKLGWSRQQVMQEARALFTHCGRALQKRRQKREWSDLLSRVKSENCIERDPADEDPELMARLEANKLAAVQKESEILERYSMMQNLPPRWTINTNRHAARDDSNNSFSSNESSDENDSTNNNKIIHAQVHHFNIKQMDNVNISSEQNIVREFNESVTNSESCSDSTHCADLVPNSIFVTPAVITESTGSLSTEKIDSKTNSNEIITDAEYNFNEADSYFSIVKINNSEQVAHVKEVNSIKANVNNKVNTDTIQNNDSKEITSFKEGNINGEFDKENIKTDSRTNTDGNLNEANYNIEFSKVEIKREPSEYMAKLLDDIGDNYTVSILDIEDPFLVIEISDSSDED